MNNTPTLMQTEEENAPWNEQPKTKVEVTISQTLSSTQEIEVPTKILDNLSLLNEAVTEQIVLPSDCIETEGYKELWFVDDFEVILS